MKKGILFLIMIAFFAQVKAGEGKPITFEEMTLDNGLHVILHQDNSTPIVVVSIMYHVGAKNEDTARTGFAHFFEHLLFEGSKNIARGQFDKLVTNAGGDNNANTSNDRTFYYETLPSNQLELGLYLESERLLHANIDEIGVETQREVVKEEKRQRYDNQPYGTFFIEILKNAYEVHPYRWAPIGSLDHLNAATLQEFMDFYNTFYVPENATLVIAGDLEYAKTKALVKKYFNDIPRGEKPVPRPTEVEPVKTKEVRNVVYDNIQLPAIISGYHIPAQGTKDAYALEMLATLLSGGESSRLNKTIVDEKELAVATGAFTFSMEHPGLYIVYGISSMGVDVNDLEKAIDAEFDKVKMELISDQEFQKIRNQTENDFILSNATLEGIADNLATYHTFYKDANLINTELDKYLAVTKEDIQRVAQQYLTKQNRVVLHFLPKSEQSK
jgi:predicted Zn-dependent peptidase